MPFIAFKTAENFPPTGGLTPLPSGSGGFMNPEAIVEAFALREGMRVADFGCGSGYFTILMAKKVGESGVVTALDIMESPLETVRAKASIVNLNNIQTVRADLEVLGGSGLADSSQDVVLLANILFQSDKRLEIVREAKRATAPGGFIVFIDWKKGLPAGGQGGGGVGPPESNRVGAEEIRAILEGEGFSFVREIDAGAFHFGMIYEK